MSSPLDETQQEFYRVRFGDRYSTVQEQPLRPSRKVRRALERNKAITGADAALLHAQNDIAARLSRGF